MCVFQNKKKSIIVSHLANLFTVWLNIRQLESPICFCTESLSITCSLWKTTLYNCERMRMKKANNVLVLPQKFCVVFFFF